MVMLCKPPPSQKTIKSTIAGVELEVLLTTQVTVFELLLYVGVEVVNVHVGRRVKVAVTVFAASMVTVQVPVPEHPAPLQPVKDELALALALNVTTVFVLYAYEQAVPQSMYGLLVLVTRPDPVPDLVIVNVLVAVESKFAATVLTASIVTTQVPVPEHPAPLQPVKVELAPAVAVSVTLVLFAKA